LTNQKPLIEINTDHGFQQIHLTRVPEKGRGSCIAKFSKLQWSQDNKGICISCRFAIARGSIYLGWWVNTIVTSRIFEELFSLFLHFFYTNNTKLQVESMLMSLIQR